MMEMVKLGDLCEINMGKTPSRNEPKYWGGNNSWVAISDLKGDVFISKTKEGITDLALKESGIKPVQKGTLLYSFKLSIGKVAITEKQLYTNEAIVALPIKDSKKVNNKYLYYAIQQVDLTGIGDKAVKGITLNKEKLKILEIPLPPLSTQQQIASILDKADALRRKDQALLKKYDELAQGIFMDMFGDNSNQLFKGRDILKVLGGAAFKSSDYCEDGIPLIRIGTINKGYFDKNQLVYLPISFENMYFRYIVKPNDLLITLTGTIGKDDYGNIFRLSNNYTKSFLNQRVAKLDFNENVINRIYLEYFFKQKETKEQLTGVSRGVRQANISNEDIYKMEIPIPNFDLQKEFDAKITNLMNQKHLFENTQAHSEALFQSLLQQAFKGELV